jgi:O-antigen/teichoic acid export membrane protein
VLAGVAITFILLAQHGFSKLIFGTPERTELVALLGVGLLGVIAMNYLVELFSALRNVRLIAGLQLINSLTFAGLGVYLLLTWQCAAVSVLLAYVGACALTATVGSFRLLRHWRALPGAAEPPPHRALWAKLLPFAAWIWVINITANLFVIADRYMIVHYSTFSTSEALAQVGEYHSSRVLPVFLISITAAVSSIVTAHLSHDWEAGRRERACARLNLFLKLFGFALSAAAVMILLAAPLLFGVAFNGKFAGGLAVLPWTLTYCLWFAMFGIVGKYLLCREKAHLASLALLVGLVVNVGLNLVLLPRLGLLGAVLATTGANLVALLLVSTLSRLLGFRMDAGTWVALALPAVVCLGPWVALVVLIAVAVEATVRNRLLSGEEKRWLVDGLLDYRERFRAFRLSPKSAASRS